MKYTLLLLVFITNAVFAQHAFDQPVVIKNLKKHVNYLADDKLEGRRTGTKGEMLAAKYISKQFKKYKIQKAGTNGYLQPFTVNDGRTLEAGSYLKINGKAMELESDYFPLSFSGGGAYINVEWFDVKSSVDKLKDNPHYNIQDDIRNAATEAEKSKKALIVYNSGSVKDELAFDKKSKMTALEIPVVYVNYSSMQKHAIKAGSAADMLLNFQQQTRTGHNVVGYIDNGAENTIVLGAHYDHLGYGEDKNSLYVGTPMVHNGADDNASGTSAMLELARMLKKNEFKNNNYLFIAFSGEELGLYGSRYFVENYPHLNKINYMINMDMVGRAADSARKLTVGGFGTSPVWGDIIKQESCLFDLKIDSSGSGPSDHTSFYKKDIPVLFFFTGTHMDYHKPSDDADKISYFGTSEVVRYVYSIIQKTDNRGKLGFLKTREASMGRSSFKVTMGVLLDYTFSGKGIYVDGVSDDRPAAKAGIQRGDVIYQMGDYKITDVTTYMQALNKFNKGETIEVKLTRGNDDVTLSLTF